MTTSTTYECSSCQTVFQKPSTASFSPCPECGNTAWPVSEDDADRLPTQQLQLHRVGPAAPTNGYANAYLPPVGDEEMDDDSDETDLERAPTAILQSYSKRQQEQQAAKTSTPPTPSKPAISTPPQPNASSVPPTASQHMAMPDIDDDALSHLDRAFDDMVQMQPAPWPVEKSKGNKAAPSTPKPSPAMTPAAKPSRPRPVTMTLPAAHADVPAMPAQKSDDSKGMPPLASLAHMLPVPPTATPAAASTTPTAKPAETSTRDEPSLHQLGVETIKMRAAPSPEELRAAQKNTEAEELAKLPPPSSSIPNKTAAIAAAAALVIGIGLGALFAPSDPAEQTPQGRAQKMLATGNRAYQTGQYDAAIDAYQQALQLDNTLHVALRAKGAALARKNKAEDAADAYQAYLENNSSATDATELRNMLKRYQNGNP